MSLAGMLLWRFGLATCHEAPERPDVYLCRVRERGACEEQ
jgi:hypothetical protein